MWGCLLFILLISCGAPSAARPTRTSAPTRTPAPRQPTAVPRGYMSHDLLGDDWPLTVDSGTIVCDRAAILFRAPDLHLYAVNGTALSQAGSKGWRDIHELSVATGNGMIKSLQPLLDAGAALCSR